MKSKMIKSARRRTLTVTAALWVAITALGLHSARAAEPYLVENIGPGAADGVSGSSERIANAGGILVFAADDGEHGEELWRSDGTAEGTFMLMDIHPEGGSSIGDMLEFGDLVVFNATDGVNGEEPWRTDGTVEGTFPLGNLNPTGDADFREGIVFGNLLLFSAQNNSSNDELWKTDGTPEGTMLVKEIDPSPTSGSGPPSDFGVVNGVALFEANEGGDNQLWKTDGTPEGTNRLKIIHPSASASISQMTSLDHVALFSASDDEHMGQLWKSDGTAEGTERLMVINNTQSASISRMTRVGNRVFFQARGSDDEVGLWVSDGTVDGTQLVEILRPGADAVIEEITDLNGLALFKATDGVNGAELWISHGTDPGTDILKDIDPSGSSSPDNLIRIGDSVYFQADDVTHGIELWKTEGTTGGTILLYDLAPGVADSDPRPFVPAGGKLFFTADPGDGTGRELYALDVPEDRLLNVATRGFVGTGDNVMIAGFIIGGAAKRVLIRAQGPSLDAFGVPNTLNDPTLAIFSGATQIAFNDDWRDTQETQIEATGLAPGFDVESAIILEIGPGPFTAVVSGGIGNAIVEVFELN